MTDAVKKFNPLAVSSKFSICGLPIRVDTYKTCGFGCRYCFSNCREFMPHTSTFEVGDMNCVRRKLARIEAGKCSESDFLAKLISNGYTWHCGGMSDPFQPAERDYQITKELVDITNEHGIHVLYSTKSDTVYAADIRPDNASFQLSITNLGNRKDLEPGVPDIQKRIDFYRALKNEGFRVGIRIQPFIPNVSTLDIVKTFADADNFTLEGLKLVPQNQEHCEYMRQLLHLTKDDFTLMGLLNLKPEIRERMYAPFIEYFKERNIPFSIADNDMHDIGTNFCCCGDALVRKSTSFNSTALSKQYGKWTKGNVDTELKKCGICNCRCSGCFASNRLEGCKTVQQFYDKRYFRPSSTFSPEYILAYKAQAVSSYSSKSED